VTHLVQRFLAQFLRIWFAKVVLFLGASCGMLYLPYLLLVLLLRANHLQADFSIHSVVLRDLQEASSFLCPSHIFA
jgi:hypothetical protein